MSEEIQPKSAQIFQFPVGGRAALGVRRAAHAVRPADLMPARAANVACGTCWYHEDAVRDAEPAPKR
jgi:hypothetical protein